MALSPRYASHVVGSGPIAIELWLDYVCPFSKKQFDKIWGEVADEAEKKFPGKFRWVFQHQVQPWHAQSTWLHEAAIAVGLVDPSKFWEFSSVLYQESSSFYDQAIVNRSRTQIFAEVSKIAAKVGINTHEFVKLTDIEENLNDPHNPGPTVTNDLKYFVKIGRQTGIHVSPTVLINGLVDNAISSSWTTEQWLEKLQQTVDGSKL